MSSLVCTRLAELLKRTILATYLHGVRQSRGGQTYAPIPVMYKEETVSHKRNRLLFIVGTIWVKIWMEMKTATYHAVTPEQADWWPEGGHQEQSLGKAMVLGIPCKSPRDPLPCSFSGLIPTCLALAPFKSSLIGLWAVPLHPPDRPHLRVPTPIPLARSLS